jgi:hypothetical protein
MSTDLFVELEPLVLTRRGQRRKFAALAAITRRPIRILRCRVPK